MTVTAVGPAMKLAPNTIAEMLAFLSMLIAVLLVRTLQILVDGRLLSPR